MKRFLLPLLLPAVAVMTAYAGSSSINWKKTYPVAAAEAKSSGKLMMIDFYTDWCGWCKKLDADTYPADAVVKQSDKFVSIKLNAEKDADGIRLAKKFGINGYPTILFLDSNETLAYKVVGYEPAKDFADSMVKAATIRQDSARFKAALKANPNDFEGLVGMAGIEASMGNADAAAKDVDLAAKSVTGTNRGKLLTAYNNVGDGYQNTNQYDKAIPYFSKAIVAGFDDQSAYARISIAVCYASTGKIASAKPFLQDLLKMDKAPKEYVDQAKDMLKQLGN
ncbi:MAG: thioredoxin family protein [Fimbriimonas sp.]|nr:thioredoxin family protein [Fimbriimonas sp.]